MTLICCYILSLAGITYLSADASSSEVRGFAFTTCVVGLAVCICVDAIKAVMALFHRTP